MHHTQVGTRHYNFLKISLSILGSEVLKYDNSINTSIGLLIRVRMYVSRSLLANVSDSQRSRYVSVS